LHSAKSHIWIASYRLRTSALTYRSILTTPFNINIQFTRNQKGQNQLVTMKISRLFKRLRRRIMGKEINSLSQFAVPSTCSQKGMQKYQILKHFCILKYQTSVCKFLYPRSIENYEVLTQKYRIYVSVC